MPLILLNVSDEAHGDTTVVVVAFVSTVVLLSIFVYIANKFFNIKEAKKIGGIRRFCPNLIDFIMKNYPLAKVVDESSVDMTISAVDVYQFVKMFFYLEFNTKNMDVEIKGKIIPDNEKWPSVPPQEFSWLITKGGDEYADEWMVIKSIQKDMVFKPEDKNNI